MAPKPNNRLTLDALFRGSAAVVIEDRTVYVRVLSESESRDIGMESALYQSKLRKRLRDPESQEFAFYLAPLEDLSDEGLQNEMVDVQMMRWRKEASDRILPSFVPDPEDGDEEARAEIIAQREAEFERVQTEREEYIKLAAEQYRAEYLPTATRETMLDELYDLQVRRVTFMLGQERDLALVVLRAYSDDPELSKPLFPSLDAVMAVHPKVRSRLFDEYSRVANIDPFD